MENVCEKFGGDPKRVVLAGFSRGAIACNYIGLHDDDIASLWCGFICHSHYDGVSEKWDYPNADRKSAAIRLARLGDRPQFISQEGSVAVTKAYLEKAHPTGNLYLPRRRLPRPHRYLDPPRHPRTQSRPRMAHRSHQTVRP